MFHVDLTLSYTHKRRTQETVLNRRQQCCAMSCETMFEQRGHDCFVKVQLIEKQFFLFQNNVTSRVDDEQ